MNFCSYRVREKYMRNRRQLKGSGITINEDLTAKNFKLLRDAQAHEKVSTAWSSDGRVIALIAGSGEKKLIMTQLDLTKL